MSAVAAPARSSPPGPRPHLLLGNLPEFAKDVLGFFTACAREHGDVASMHVAGRTAFLLSSPELIDQVLVGQQRNFIKHTWFWRHVEAVFGQGLLTAEGDHWLKQRRTIQPAFHYVFHPGAHAPDPISAVPTATKDAAVFALRSVVTY